MQNVNVNKLKGKMVENGVSVESLAEQMGLRKSTLYRKLQNPDEIMLIKDANSIIRILGLSADDAVSIFFNQFVILFFCKHQIPS